VNGRAIFEIRFLVLAVVAAVMVGMAWFGGLWKPVAVMTGLALGGGVAVLAGPDTDLSTALDDVPPALFALVGVGLAWGGAEYAPAISISVFAGVAVGYVVTAAVLAVAEG
jgi:hypothetical protein